MSNKQKAKPDLNADLLVRFALGFHDVAHRVGLELRGKTDFSFNGIAPAAVNFALAAELYLKALHILNNSRPNDTHELWKLFKDLPEPVRVYVEQEYSRLHPIKKGELKAMTIVLSRASAKEEPNELFPTPSTVRLLLVGHNHAFTNWRYLHEFNTNGYAYNFDFHAMNIFCDVVRDYVVELLNKRKPHFIPERQPPEE